VVKNRINNHIYTILDDVLRYDPKCIIVHDLGAFKERIDLKLDLRKAGFTFLDDFFDVLTKKTDVSQLIKVIMIGFSNFLNEIIYIFR